jgi:hypothetical protein
MNRLVNARAARPCTVAIPAALLVFAAAIPAAQEPDARSARDVDLRIETNWPKYHGGDSITVRLSLRNVSSLPVGYVAQPPVDQARLRVYDASGREVQRALPPAAQDLASTRPITLGEGQISTLRWTQGEWLNLRDWGYDLHVPGRYTIVGIPGVVGPELAPDYETVRSNRATFTILP